MKYTTKEELIETLSVSLKNRGIKNVDAFLSTVSMQEGIKKTVDRFGHIETFTQLCQAVDEMSPVAYSQGLCSNFFVYFDRNRFLVVESIFALWEKFSGRWCYPVHTDNEVTSGEQYDIAFAEGSMYEGAYGQARFELFIHTMNCLKLLCK